MHTFIIKLSPLPSLYICMSLPQRKLLLNLYSSPLSILKLAKSTQNHVNKAIESSLNGSVEEIIEKFDDISDKLCLVTDSSECIRRLHPKKRWRDAADEAFNLISSLMNELNSDKRLARKVTEISSIGLSTELGAVIESLKRDFELFKDLNDKERIRLKKLQESVHNASMEFENLQTIESLEKMIKLRFELAKAIGFKNPLELCLRDKQLNSHELVMSFINKRWDEINKQAKSQRRFGYTNVMTVVDNLITLSMELFNIRLDLFTDVNFNGEKTFKFRVFDEEKFIGTILFDLSMRKFKDPHPTHYTIKCRKQGKEGLFLISIGIKDLEKISWNDSQSLFHEFGHALHSVLSQTKYQILSGTRGSIDLVEIPSSLFELFHDSIALQEKLNKSGKWEEISGDKLRREETFQVQIAALDQLLNVTEPQKENWSRDLAHEIETKFGIC